MKLKFLILTLLALIGVFVFQNWPTINHFIEAQSGSFVLLNKGANADKKFNQETTIVSQLVPPSAVEILARGTDSEALSRTALGQNEYDKEVMELVRKYRGVNRDEFLSNLYAGITRNARSDIEKFELVQRWMGRSLLPVSAAQPFHPESGQMVVDPLVLLSLNRMGCGQFARVAVDLFQAGGYQGRVVQLAGHVVAEIFIAGRWRLIDNYLFGSQTIANSPSLRVLSLKPEVLDRHPTNFVALLTNNVAGANSCTRLRMRYPSSYYFRAQAYKDQHFGPWYYIKESNWRTFDDPETKLFFGWGRRHTITQVDFRPVEIPVQHVPDRVSFRDISVKGKQVRLSWCDSVDEDGDLEGYQIFVSGHSRGWQYPRPEFGRNELMKFASTAEWGQKTVDRLYVLPPSEVMTFKQKKAKSELSLSPGTYFVTVMPYDSYGTRIGRRIFPMSEEIKIEIPQDPSG